MAMKVKSPPELKIAYELFSLPSAQHKAGLAGLLLLIESLRWRKKKPLPNIVGGPTTTGVTLELTPESLKTVYDDFFNPIVVEVPDGKGKTKPKEFPDGEFLTTLGMPPVWLNIWRDVIRNVIRAGAPAQFKPYRDRIKSAKRPKTWDWEKTWMELVKDNQTSLSASDYFGAESTTADGVPFKNRAREAFLLTFAPVASLPFLSQTLKRTSRAGERVFRFQRNAYVVATPEVSDLRDFVSEHPTHLATLDPATIGNSRNPTRALISVPEEGGLEFLASHRIAKEETAEFPTADGVSGVMITHLEYGKGSPHVQYIGMVRGSKVMLDEYRQIRDQSWNYLYRELRIRNLLDGQYWHTGADQFFGEYPAEAFVYHSGAPRLYFDSDVQRQFRAIRQTLADSKGHPEMIDEWPDKELADRIYWLTQTYVNHRTQDRCDGMTWDDYTKGKGDKENYRKQREKICLDAFLALRGRDDSDLVSYFVGTLCTVPQSLNQQQFRNVSEHLLTNPLKIKTLTMLALSAHSYLWDGDTKESKKNKAK